MHTCGFDGPSGDHDNCDYTRNNHALYALMETGSVDSIAMALKNSLQLLFLKALLNQNEMHPPAKFSVLIQVHTFIKFFKSKILV